MAAASHLVASAACAPHEDALQTSHEVWLCEIFRFDHKHHKHFSPQVLQSGQTRNLHRVWFWHWHVAAWMHWMTFMQNRKGSVGVALLAISRLLTLLEGANKSRLLDDRMSFHGWLGLQADCSTIFVDSEADWDDGEGVTSAKSANNSQIWWLGISRELTSSWDHWTLGHYLFDDCRSCTRILHEACWWCPNHFRRWGMLIAWISENIRKQNRGGGLITA